MENLESFDFATSLGGTMWRFVSQRNLDLVELEETLKGLLDVEVANFFDESGKLNVKSRAGKFLAKKAEVSGSLSRLLEDIEKALHAKKAVLAAAQEKATRRPHEALPTPSTFGAGKKKLRSSRMGSNTRR